MLTMTVRMYKDPAVNLVMGPDTGKKPAQSSNPNKTRLLPDAEQCRGQFGAPSSTRTLVEMPSHATKGTRAPELSCFPMS
jgi:hypothetical protein